MKKSIKLPIDFINSLNEEQKKGIRAIEDRIEQNWKLMDIILCINIINSISGPVMPPPMPQASDQAFRDMTESVRDLARALEIENKDDRSQFDIDRDNIWSAVRRNGVGVVLSFVDANIITNIEKLFAGLVISYISMFNSGVRTKLPASKIFASDEDLKIRHKRFYDLRDEWYAHVGREDGRHSLRYRVDDERKIFIDKIGDQNTPEYHSSERVNLSKCIKHVSNFIDGDLDKRVIKIMESLMASQRDILCSCWDTKMNKRN